MKLKALIAALQALDEHPQTPPDADVLIPDHFAGRLMADIDGVAMNTVVRSEGGSYYQYWTGDATPGEPFEAVVIEPIG